MKRFLIGAAGFILAVLMVVAVETIRQEWIFGQATIGSCRASGGGTARIPCRYLVYENLGTVYCYDGLAGSVDTSGPAATGIIQYALSHLTVGRLKKEKVVVEGDYTGLSPITLTGYTLLEIQGRWVAKDSMDWGYFLSNSDSATNTSKCIEICGGGRIDGNKEKGKVLAGHSTIGILNCDYVSIHDLTVKGGNSCPAPHQERTGDGIWIDSCNFVSIQNCFCDSADYDNIYVQRSNSGVICGNMTRRGGNGGIQINNASNFTISNNTIFRPGSSGIRVAHGCSLLVISGNDIKWSSDYGLDIKDGSTHNIFTGNSIYSGFIGINLMGSAKCYKNLIANNMIYDNVYGLNILASGADSNYFVNNVVDKSQNSNSIAIRVLTGNNDNTFRGNWVRGFVADTAIWIADPTKVVMRGNSFGNYIGPASSPATQTANEAIQPIEFTIQNPKNLPGDSLCKFMNGTGHTIQLLGIAAENDYSDDFDFTLTEHDSSGRWLANIKAVQVSNNGPSGYFYMASEVSPDNPFIENKNTIWFVATKDSARSVSVRIRYGVME